MLLGASDRPHGSGPDYSRAEEVSQQAEAAGSSSDVSALALGEDLSPWKLCRASCSGVNSQISHRGDILAAFQLPCPSFAAGELVSTHGLGPGVALRVKRSTDACLPNPCQHQGQCQVTEDRPVCSCMPGFTGEFCQGRAGNAGELSPVGPWAPEGRVMGTVHWCYHCSPLLEHIPAPGSGAFPTTITISWLHAGTRPSHRPFSSSPKALIPWLCHGVAGHATGHSCLTLSEQAHAAWHRYSEAPSRHWPKTVSSSSEGQGHCPCLVPLTD